VEGFDFGAHAVRRQRVLDLSGDVAVDEAQAKRQKPDQNQSDETRSETIAVMIALRRLRKRRRRRAVALGGDSLEGSL